jgi:hypothetical protein
MSGRILSPEDRSHLLRMMRRQTPSTVHRRMNTLLLLDDGWAAERVAEVLFIDVETVREHRRLYQASGVTGVGQLKYEGAEPALSPEQFEALAAELDSTLYMTAKAVCASYVDPCVPDLNNQGRSNPAGSPIVPWSPRPSRSVWRRPVCPPNPNSRLGLEPASRR